MAQHVNWGRASVRNTGPICRVLDIRDLPIVGDGDEGILALDTRYILELPIDYRPYTLNIQDGSTNIFEADGSRLVDFRVNGFTSDGLREFILRDIKLAGVGTTTPLFNIIGVLGGPGVGNTFIRLIGPIEFFQYPELGSISTTQRFEMSNIDIVGCQGPLELFDIRFAFITGNSFGGGTPFGTTTQDFTWMRFSGRTTSIIINQNDIVIKDETVPFARNTRALFISPVIEGFPLPGPPQPIPTPRAIITDNNAIGSPIAGPDFFEQGDEDEITNIADAGGGFVTLSTADTGVLANDDAINILRTENYNGGYLVSNVVANVSFDIEATYVDNPQRGTWHSGSLDQRDPKLIVQNNTGTANGRTVASGHVTGNVTATTIALINTWVNFNVPGFTDDVDNIERFSLMGDGSAAQFVFQDLDDATTNSIGTVRVIRDQPGVNIDTYEFGISIDGADPVDYIVSAPVNGNVDQNLTLLAPVMLAGGSYSNICPMVRCTSGALDILIKDYISLIE